VRVRLVVQGEVEPGTSWEFWKELPEASGVPSVGDKVSLGVATGAANHLNFRVVESVEWSDGLDYAVVRLEDLHAGWLTANRARLGEAGWVTAMAD